MPRKVEVDLVRVVLQRNDLDVRKVAEIMEQLTAEIERREEEPKPPQVRKQFVMLVSDPEERLVGKDLVGWVLQIPEEEAPFLAVEKLTRAAYEYNASPKGRRMPVSTIGEACESVQPKFCKEHQVWVRTKEPVLVVRTDNTLPTGAPADPG